MTKSSPPTIVKSHIPVCVDGESHGLDSDVLSSPSWAVLTTSGEPPSPRVGHSCHVIGDHLIVIGGANPSMCAGDVHSLHLDTLDWTKRECTDGELSFPSRYEHWGITLSSGHGVEGFPTQCVIVLGGASEEGFHGLEEAFVLDTALWKWTRRVLKGSAPNPRTQSTCAVVNNIMYVWGGGESSVRPVGDVHVQSLDLTTLKWERIKSRGTVPAVRLGHSMNVWNGKVVVFGGLNGEQFYGDTYLFDVDCGKWRKPAHPKGMPLPAARSGHGAVVEEDLLFIFGGMGQNEDGETEVFKDVWCLDLRTWVWNEVKGDNCEGASERLSHGMCVVSRSVGDCDLDLWHDKEIIVFGGMDVKGNFYCDTHTMGIPKRMLGAD